MPTSQHREPPSPKPAHLPANTAKTAAKTLLSAPIQSQDPPNALLELAEMRGNEREIDLSVFSPRNDKWVPDAPLSPALQIGPSAELLQHASEYA